MNEMAFALTVKREKEVLQHVHTLFKSTDSLVSMTEPVGPTLNNLFILRIGNTEWLGRKRASLTINGALHLSSITTPDMLLGKLLNFTYARDGLTLHFNNATHNKKTTAFTQALEDITSELYYPFPVLNTSGQELVMHAEDWSFSEHLAQTLNADEQHFRDYCVTLLQHVLQPGALLFDPACSTGDFIASLASALPHTRCVGADRSLSMVEQARARHRLEFYHHAAEDMPDAVDKCDVLFLRFLNAEVISREDANALIQLLLPRLKPGATAIIFGHTPVLPNIRYWAQALGLTLKSSVAARPGHVELFEFYVLEARGRFYGVQQADFAVAEPARLRPIAKRS